MFLGLSTWFQEPGAVRVEGLSGFVRVWDETLHFLKDNDLLHNIYYVDLLNEYPLFSGFADLWLRKQMDRDIATRSNHAKNEGHHEWKEKCWRLQQRGISQVLRGICEPRDHTARGEMAGFGFPVLAHHLQCR